MTKITLETSYGACAVEVKEDDLSISEVVQLLVIPVLLGAGYAPKNVAEAIGE